MKNCFISLDTAIMVLILLAGFTGCDNTSSDTNTTYANRISDAAPSDTVSALWTFKTDEASLEALLKEQHAAILRGELPQYSTPEELARQYGVADSDREIMVSYLKKQGISGSIDITGSFADTTMTVQQVEQLLGTTVGRYVLRGCSLTEAFLMADKEPVIPAELRETVPSIVGLQSIPIRCMEKRLAVHEDNESIRMTTDQSTTPCAFCEHSGTAQGGCEITKSGFFAPNQLNTAYGVDMLHALGLKGEGTRAAIISEPTYPENFQAFLKCFPDLFDQPINVVYHTTHRSGLARQITEGIVDLEAMVWAAPHVDQIDYYIGGYNAASSAQAMSQMLAQKPLPDVLSVSWGFSQQQIANTNVNLPPIDPAAWKTYQGLIFRAAASGITPFFAAGDNGSTFVSAPASSPYVTAVGGTNLLLDETNQIVSQGVWNSYLVSGGNTGGGGGATNVPGSPMPEYQFNTPGISGAVFADGKYRLAPDISAYASETPGIAIFAGAQPVGQQWQLGNGTSFATPYAAGASLLLAQAVKQLAGWKHLGHLNPFLYSAARENYTQYFYDVTEVSNNLGPNNPNLPPNGPDCCVAGTYYDKASGLGSVKLDTFFTYLINFTN